VAESSCRSLEGGREAESDLRWAVTGGLRLATYSRKNRLYFAFRELGRAIRTDFLLRYLSSASSGA
jgi:hypothetical protein